MSKAKGMPRAGNGEGTRAEGSAGGPPFVHCLKEGRIQLLVVPYEGKWALNIVDFRPARDNGPWVVDFDRREEAFMYGHGYVRKVAPGHDCRASGCHFGGQH